MNSSPQTQNKTKQQNPIKQHYTEQKNQTGHNKSPRRSSQRQRQRQKSELSQKEQRERQRQRQREREGAQTRKYDYFNKYNQHQLVSSSLESRVQQFEDFGVGEFKEKLRRLREMRGDGHRRVYFLGQQAEHKDRERKSVGLQLRRNYNTAISLPKHPNPTTKPQASPIQPQPHQTSPYSPQEPSPRNLPHFAYLQAYKKNTTISDPYTFNNQYETIPSAFNSPARKANENSGNLGSSNREIQRVLGRIPNLTHGLSREISYQNQIIKAQVNQYRAIVARLEIDLAQTKQELNMAYKTIQRDRHSYQQIINRLQSQLQSLPPTHPQASLTLSPTLSPTNPYPDPLQTQPNQSNQQIISKQLSLQLNYQNQLIRGQVIELQKIVQKLEKQLSCVREQCAFAEGDRDRLMVENGRLVDFRERYYVLNEELMAIHQANRSKSKSKYMDTDKQNREISNTVPVRLFQQENNYTFSSKQKGKIRKNEGKESQRSKLNSEVKKNSINQYNSIVIRLESIFQGDHTEDKKNNHHITKYGQQLLQKVECLISKNKKYQDFIYNIGQMYKKIQGCYKTSQFTLNQSHKPLKTSNKQQKMNSSNISIKVYKNSSQPTIRQLWKWLKFVGSIYNYLLSIKPFLGRKIGVTEQQAERKQVKEILESLLMSC